MKTCFLLCVLGLSLATGAVVKRQVGASCPLFCDMVYAPVCGTDDKTYGNECELEHQSCRNGITITVAYNGQCIQDGVGR